MYVVGRTGAAVSNGFRCLMREAAKNFLEIVIKITGFCGLTCDKIIQVVAYARKTEFCVSVGARCPAYGFEVATRVRINQIRPIRR